MKVIGLLCGLLASWAPAQAATVFFEDFEEVPFQAFNFTGLDQFAISDGSIDAFQNRGFTLGCPSLGCIDLDGSSLNAARIESDLLNLGPGRYELVVNAAGNRRLGSDQVSIGITGGILGATQFLFNFDDPFGLVRLSFELDQSASGRIFFDHAGGDNIGILVDRVQLDLLPDSPVPVPLPAGLTLLLAALGLTGALRLRARQDNA